MSKAVVYSTVMAGAVGGGIGSTLLVSKLTSAYWQFKESPKVTHVKDSEETEWVCGLLKESTSPQEKSWLCALLISLEKLNGSEKTILLPEEVTGRPNQLQVTAGPAVDTPNKWRVTVYVFDKGNKDKQKLWKLFDNFESLKSLKIRKEAGTGEKTTLKFVPCKDTCPGQQISCCSPTSTCKTPSNDWCTGEEVNREKKENIDVLWKVDYLVSFGTTTNKESK